MHPLTATALSMCKRATHPVAAVLELFEQLRDGRMIDRATFGISHEISLADIGHVGGFLVLGEQVVEWLVARRADVLGDGFVPFFAIGEDRIDIEDHTAEIEESVANNLANAEPAAR